jgi:hypothetical protein
MATAAAAMKYEEEYSSKDLLNGFEQRPMVAAATEPEEESPMHFNDFPEVPAGPLDFMSGGSGESGLFIGRSRTTASHGCSSKISRP